MSKLQLSIDHVSVVDGQRQTDDGSRNSRGSGRHHVERAGIAITSPAGLFTFKPNKGRLIVLAEPDMPGGIEAGPLVADWIADNFKSDSSASVTSSLTRALHTVHSQLSKENLKSLSSDRRSVAVACAVIRDHELYLAQIGPTMALRLRDSKLAVIGEVPSTDPISFACTMGSDCDIEIHLCHEEIMPGDIVIICSTSILRIADGLEIARCLQAGDSRAIVDALYHLHEVSLNPEDFSAVAVVAGGPQRRSPRNLEEPEPEAELAEDQSEYRRDDDVEDNWGRSRGSNRAIGARSTSRFDDSMAATRSRSRFGADAKIDQDRRRWDDGAEGKRRGARPDSGEKRNRSRKIDLRRIIVFGGLPLALIVAALAGAFFLLSGYQTREQQEQVQTTLQKVEQSEREAQATQDVVLKMRLLSEADRLANQAAAAKSDDPTVLATRDRIRKQLDELTNSVRLPSARKIVDLAQESRDSDPGKLIVQGIDVYILDKGTDRIYKYLLDGSGDQVQPSANPVIVRQRDRIGNAAVGHLEAMTWIPPGGSRLRGSLVFVDDAGAVYEYDSAKGLAVLKTPSNFKLDSVQALGGYAGSLYVLAPKQKRLVWFPPSGQGYEKGPYNYVNPETPVDLSAAVDFTVDSGLFILYSNGKIDRFYAGRPQPFDTSVADVPLKSPTSIFGSLSTSSVYVVDAANQRVVQFSRDGHFERQFRYGGSDNIFNGIRGVSVDEQRGKFYILSDRKLFVTDIGK